MRKGENAARYDFFSNHNGLLPNRREIRSINFPFENALDINKSNIFFFPKGEVRVKQVRPKYQRGSKNGISEQVGSSKSRKVKRQSGKDGVVETKLVQNRLDKKEWTLPN